MGAAGLPGQGALAHLAPAWRERFAAAIVRDPFVPRVPVRWRGAELGSVEPALLGHPGLRHVAAGTLVRQGDGWEVLGDDLTASLGRIADALREAGLAHVWRNEQLAVRDAAGRELGTMERGAVRLLGIPTDAVHLAAWAPDGRFWVQQRAFDKPTDPGRWDTLVGGMVPAGETADSALPRECLEEAGLALARFEQLEYGGCVETRRPSAELAHGLVVERLHWFRAVLPPGVEPVNQDGEVAQFACWGADEVCARLERGEFTLDAAAILLAASD